jgi:rhodanese-related sulfurtransferase
MTIDLRTGPEKLRAPRVSDIEIEVPLPPLSPDVQSWLRETLLHIAGAHPRETFRVFCAKGNRSGTAARILQSAGYKVVDLGGVN